MKKAKLASEARRAILAKWDREWRLGKTEAKQEAHIAPLERAVLEAAKVWEQKEFDKFYAVMSRSDLRKAVRRLLAAEKRAK